MEESSIPALRETWGRLYEAELRGVTYVFRALTVREFQYALEHMDMSSADMEDYLVLSCVLLPENLNIDRLPAGFISSLAAEILDVSGFNNPEISSVIWTNAQEESSKAHNVLKAVILAAYPYLRISEEEIDQLTFDQLARKAALAEQVLKIHKVVADPDLEFDLTISDPQEEQEAQQEADPIAERLHGI